MGADTDDSLDIGVLCSDAIPRWQRRALDRAIAETSAEITHVVMKEPEVRGCRTVPYYRRALRRVRNYPLWSLVGVGRSLTPTPEHERFDPISDVKGVSTAERVYCRPEPADDFGVELPAPVVDELAAAVDVLVRCHGFGILKGEILQAPQHGVLSYHFGDINEYRGRMGRGFWEFVGGDDATGVTLQQITETIDGGGIVVLERVNIGDMYTWQAIKRRGYVVAEGMLVTAVRKLTDPTFTPSQPDEGEYYTLPTGTAVGRYLVANTAGRIRRWVREQSSPGESRA